jgi:pimeloyl-ACP methyl ester carboxylesterase
MVGSELQAAGSGRRSLVIRAATLLGSAAAVSIAASDAAQSAEAAAAAPTAVVSGVTYQFLGRWDVEKLNDILTVGTPKFAGVAVAYTSARNAINLYRVVYPSVVPELGNKPIAASGLIAIPETGQTKFPMVSYQHGTVWGKQEVPSFPDQSAETQLMLAQFGGQGYIVVAADYFGMGLSTEPEAYLVKASHQQACYDMLMASRAVLDHMTISAAKLCLGGWSQGGFVTMAFLESLENAGIPVAGAATASAPVDTFVAISGFLDFPRVNDAVWAPALLILTAFSFENYYGASGLARSLINEDCYDLCRRAYERLPFDQAQVPDNLFKLIRPSYFDAQFFAASEYGQIISGKTHAYRWIIRSPVQNYYGLSDEVISVGLGQLAMRYQRAIGSGNMAIEAIATGKTNHRGTFATAVPMWKAWFDSLVSAG